MEESAKQKERSDGQNKKQLLEKDQTIENLSCEIENIKSTVQSQDLQRIWRDAERKLRLQLSSKDVKLKQLKEAIKSLEDKLVEALKRNADE